MRIGDELEIREEAQKFHLPEVAIYLGKARIVGTTKRIFQVKAKSHFVDVVMGYESLLHLKADYRVKGEE